MNDHGGLKSFDDLIGPLLRVASCDRLRLGVVDDLEFTEPVADVERRRCCFQDCHSVLLIGQLCKCVSSPAL